MNRITRKLTIALLAAAAVFGARAEWVAKKDATRVAQQWTRRGGAFGAKLGAGFVERTDEHKTSSGTSFYSVKMYGGGTVFVAGDTDMTPIVAFTSDPTSFATIDRKSPLWALLERRGAIQTNALTQAALAKAATDDSTLKADAARAEVVRKACNDAWRKLLIEEASSSDPVIDRSYAGSDSVYGISTPSDVRVAPLVKTKWEQGNVQNGACANYYTPNGPEPGAFMPGDKNNVVCGCVALAMAQVMKYHSMDHAPWHETYRNLDVTPITRECTWEGRKAFDLTMQGGTYDWDNMTLIPAVESLGEVNRQAIGKLASDCGISVYMQYGEEGSGAFSFDVRGALTEQFGFKNAAFFYDAYGLVSRNNSIALGKAFYASLDAGCPVIVGITGHEVVADGYGFDNGNDYVHINMGWAGESDMWFNLPYLYWHGSEYFMFEDATYNVFPEHDSSYAVLSGRVIDSDGGVVEDATVSVYRAGTDTLVTNLTPNARGIWAAILKAGVYDLRAVSANGLFKSVSEGVVLKTPYTEEVEWNKLGRMIPTVDFTDIENVGNSWGNDLVLEPPAAELWVDGAYVDEYFKLERVIRAAYDVHANDAAAKIVIKVVNPLKFTEPAVVDFDLTIVATNETPSVSSIRRMTSDVKLTVRDGARLFLTNVVFAAANKNNPVVDVKAGSTVAIAGTVDFGCPLSRPAVTTANADGFELAGAIDRTFAIDCAGEMAQFDTFAWASCDFLTASNVCTHIVNPTFHIDDIGAVAYTNAEGEVWLKWDVLPVLPEDAEGYILHDDGTRSYYRHLDRLMREFLELGIDGTVVLNNDGFLSEPFVISNDVVIAAEREGLVIDCAPETGFVINETGRLTVTNLTFVNYIGDHALIKVSGKTTSDGRTVLGHGYLELQSGAGFRNITGLAGKISGAVTLEKGGQALVRDGVTFDSCTAYGKRDVAQPTDAHGGAVYVGNKGSKLVLEGGTFRNCSSRTSGGAIYVYTGGVLEMSGAVEFPRDYYHDIWNYGYGNGDEAKNKVDDDIYLMGSMSGFELGGPLESTSPIFVRFGTGAKGKRGTNDVFVASAELLPEEREAAAELFVHGDNDALMAAVVDGEIRWVLKPTDNPGVEPTDTDIQAVVTPADGTGVRYYTSVNEAFESLTCDADIEIRSGGDAFYAHDIVVTNNVRLFSSVDGGGYLFARAYAEGNPDMLIRVRPGATLTMSNLTIQASYTESGDVFTAIQHGVVKVEGGTFVMQGGAMITDNYGDYYYGLDNYYPQWCTGGDRASGAVTVKDGGVFRMESDATLWYCDNYYARGGDGGGAGGALTVDDGDAYLDDGMIAMCWSTRGGVCVGNKGRLHVSGTMVIQMNFGGDGDAAMNVSVDPKGKVFLKGDLDGIVGITAGPYADTNLAGYVSAEYLASGDAAAIRAGANNFINDATGARGAVVTNDIDALIVWSDAITADGYVDPTGGVYRAFASGPTPPPTPPVTPVVTPEPLDVFRMSRAGSAQPGGTEPSANTMTLSFDGAKKGLTYELLSCEKLGDEFKVEAVKTATEDGVIEFESSAEGASKFWKVRTVAE